MAGLELPAGRDGIVKTAGESYHPALRVVLDSLFVMAGLDPAIHVFLAVAKTWMPGTRPGMTSLRF